MGELSLLTDELLAKIQRIQIKAQHLANAAFAGDYRSVFKGRGIEFEEVREYQMGDDIRSIDWNVTARAGRPFIKTFRDERELTVMFVVDVSASSRFGTLTKFKNEVAAEIAALLAYTALRNNDKVGLIIFSDHVEHYTPPKKGRGHIWKIIRDVLSYRSVAKSTNYVVPLEFLNKVLKRRAITFLISDFSIILSTIFWSIKKFCPRDLLNLKPCLSKRSIIVFGDVSLLFIINFLQGLFQLLTGYSKGVKL